MTARVLTFVNTAEAGNSAPPGSEVLVLSPWWPAGAGIPTGVAGVRPIAQAVLHEVDLLKTSIEGLDRWAAEAGLPERFTLDGVAWWDRIRMELRWDVYELVLWRHVLDRLEVRNHFDAARVPADRPQLAAVCRGLGLRVDVVMPEETVQDADGPGSEANSDARAAPVSPAPSLARKARRLRIRVLRRLHFAPKPPPKLTRRERLDQRVEALAARPGFLAIAWAGAFQVMDDGTSNAMGDPFLDPAIHRLGAEGHSVAVALIGRNHHSAVDWPSIRADPRALPLSYLAQRCRADDVAVPDSTELAAELVRQPVPAFDVAGIDLAPALVEIVAGYAGPWLDERRRWFRRAGRLLDDLRPRAILTDREGTRLPWMAAARERGIPVVAVQHGMIYPGNPEYFRPHVAGSLRADRTCVFGTYERDLLISAAGYPPDEVVVTGSPRVDGTAMRLDGAAREAVRRELGVHAGDRMLVVSAAHNPIGELLTASMLATVLDGPLPGVHIVVKLHPQDDDPADYGGFFEGLAGAGGYAAPRVTVVRDVSLPRLLAVTDAHLGHSSTVLTDAVAADVPNMVALGQAQADPLGYAAAGVATPVRNVDDVRAFMADPRPPVPTARDAFLRAHFGAGDATGRVLDVILGVAKPPAAP